MYSEYISFKDFKKALNVVLMYCKQHKIIDEEITISESTTINIQQAITHPTYKILVKYYKHEYNIDLHKSDLQNMNLDLLTTIDYNKMANLKGIGPIGIAKLKKVMAFYAIV